MKKILTLATLVAFVGMASAASLNWNITSVMDPASTTGGKGADFLALLFVSEQNGTALTSIDDVTTLIESGATAVKDSEGKVTSLKTDTTEIAGAAQGKTGASGGLSGATGYNGNNFGAGDSLTAFAVIFDASDYASASNYIVTSEKSASWTSSTGSKMLGFGSQANNTNWKAVPEPATATLALAGLALLLKRRRA